MNTYKTSDFHLAITLFTLGYKLVDIDRSDARRAIFNFKFETDIENDARSFFDDQIKLNPRIFAANSRLLKERLRAV